MSGSGETWLVAGGEPAAEKFGRLVQDLRRQAAMSVDSLATLAGLSAGSIRAIEQGRRAPSEDSGVRILNALLPSGSIIKEEPDANQAVPMPSYAVEDPISGASARITFQARSAGDNRKWARDKRFERALERSWADPAVREGWIRSVQSLGDRVAANAQAAHEPPSDATLGSIVRQVSGLPARYAWRLLDTILPLWQRVEAGTADDYERRKAEELNDLLRGISYLPPDDAPVTADSVDGTELS